MFYHFPPLTDLFAAITRLLWLGFILLTIGIVTGFYRQPASYSEDCLVVGRMDFLMPRSCSPAISGTTAPA